MKVDEVQKYLHFRAEITRDELKFARFVIRLRFKFQQLFTGMLEKQLVLKGIMTIEDWNSIVADIKFDYSKDNYFTELKDNEISEARVNLARNFQDMTGKYYSHGWVRRNLLQQSDEEIADMDRQINKENDSGDPRWINPMIEQNLQMVQQQQQMADQNAMMSDQQQQQQSPGIESTQGGNSETSQKLAQVREAQVIIDQMKKKKGNRTMQDESKYKAAVQVVAKNKDILSGLGAHNQLNKDIIK